MSARAKRATTVNLLGAYLITFVIFAIVDAENARGVRNIGDNSQKPKILTVEQAGNKNIKVLKGMPNAQLIPAMQFMSASLGVRCEYCHATKDGQLDSAAEGKKQKDTARDMVRMVREINRTNFEGEPMVSCYTCHVGHAFPQGFPTLPVAMVPPAPPQQAAQSTPQQFPSGASVIDHYIAAIGGEQALQKITSCIMAGKIVTAKGATGTYQIEQVPPNRGHESVTLGSFHRERGVRDTVGWEKTPFGTVDLLPQQVPDTDLSLPLLLDVQVKRQYIEATVSGKEKINNRDAYIVDATRKDNKRERLYFEVESGLLLKRISYTPTMIGIMPEQIDFDDYRDVDGIKLPFLIRVSIADSNSPTNTRTFDDVKINLPVSDSKFGKP